MPVQSWNEWDDLQSVIVGSALGAQVPFADKSLRAINYADDPNQAEQLTGPYPRQVIEEAEEDMAELSRQLTKLGVQVHRPSVDPLTHEFATPDWRAQSYYRYCPRDSVLVHGDKIIETPMPLRARQFETLSYRGTFAAASKSGAQWITAPKPRLTDDLYDLDNIHRDKLTLTELEPCFDAANVLRCGYDLFYLVSNSGNKAGAHWLQTVLGPEFKVHQLENIYSFMHLDSTISLLRPGLVLLNPERIKKDRVPKPLDQWDAIWCPEPVDIGYYGKYKHASLWIGMNLLMVRPDLAIVEKRQLPLIRALEKNGIDVLALDVRHARTLGGGFHCVTLDLNRKGKLEKYF